MIGQQPQNKKNCPSLVNYASEGHFGNRLAMAKQLSAVAVTAARAVIDSHTDGTVPRIPGLVYCAVDKTGQVLFSHASGKTGLNQESPMTLDTTFWVASCTKLVTSIACMQLVESGKLNFDDSAQVESLAPELKRVRVLERDGDDRFRLVPKERSITLRMLLNHTCKRDPTLFFQSVCTVLELIHITWEYKLASDMRLRISSYEIGHDPLALTIFPVMKATYYSVLW